MPSVFQRFPERLQRAIVQRLGWTSLRPVQEEAGEAILDGKNAVVLAPTAGGKTEASMFPTLAQLIEQPPEGVGAIYIAPIKALLNNQADRLGLYTEMVGMDRFLWHGDVRANRKKKFVKAPCELLMTTPESLEVMLLSQSVPAHLLFQDLRIVIIDEVHALAGEDRGAHLMSVLERIRKLSRNDLQRIGLSATVGNPHDILAWIQGTSKRERVVVSPPSPPSRKSLLVHFDEDAVAITARASQDARGQKSLFFCQSRSFSEAIADAMRGRSIEVFVHHSSVSHEEREAAEESFTRGQNVSIICTSTLELGIDVGDLDRVLQANAPNTVSSFMQRMGRTGRRKDSVANTTFYCENAEAVLQAIAIVELAKKKWVESVPVNHRCWPVMVHQLLALTLQLGAVNIEEAWEHLSQVPDFTGIRRREFDHLISHMSAEGFLQRSGSVVTMGLKAERAYGRRNFMEIYAVFSTPQLYSVTTTGGRSIGSLAQNFVDRQEEGLSSFLLGGRAWQILRIDHGQRTITVSPSPSGVQPGWGGVTPQLLGFELCQQMRDVLVDTDPVPFASPSAQRQLNDLRDDLGDLLRRTGHSIQMEAGRATWWTFAGGQINHTLRYGFQLYCGFKASADNFKVTLQGEDLSFAVIEEAIEHFAREDFWRDPKMGHRLLAALPAYRLSKFQKALPERYALEMIASYLLDLPGTVRFLGGITPLEPGTLAPQGDEDTVDCVDEPDEEARFETHLPLYTLDAIAASEPLGEFGAGAPTQYVEAQGWIPVDIGKTLNERMFVCRIKGHSMDNGKSNLIDGGLAVFELWPRGTKQLKIVLVRGAFDDRDTGSYAVKRYVADRRDASSQHQVIRLVSLHHDKETYPDIVLTPECEDDLTVVAELVQALPGRHVRMPRPPTAPVDPREKNRERAAHRLHSAIERFLSGKPSADDDVEVDVTPHPETPPGSYVLRKASEGGLSVQFEALPNLLPFIPALKVCSSGFEAFILAGNTRARAWGAPVAPGVDGVHVIAAGFEEDPDVQALVAHLALPALSVDEPTVFKVDGDGIGQPLQGQTLTMGSSYRVQLPPAHAGAELPFKSQEPHAPEWAIVEVALREPPDDAYRKALESLGLTLSEGAARLSFALTGRAHRKTERDIEYPCFLRGDRVVLEVTTPEHEDTEFELILTQGENTERIPLRNVVSQRMVLSDLPVGLHAAEVYDATGTCSSARLFFAVEEQLELAPPAAIITSSMTRGDRTRSRSVEGSASLRGDFTELPDDWHITGPPCWPVFMSWRGLEPLKPERSSADAEGHFDTDTLRKRTEASRRALCGDLVLEFGELGSLTLQHDRALEQELESLRSDLQETLEQVRTHGFDDGLGFWIRYVFEALGYFLNEDSPAANMEAIRFTYGLQAYQRKKGGTVPVALLVVVAPDQDLLDRSDGTLLFRVAELREASGYPKAYVTDGLQWTAVSPSDRFRVRPIDIDEALTDALAFEELLNRYMVGGA